MREKLLREVGTLTIISTSCMTLRALALLLVADKAVFLDRMVSDVCEGSLLGGAGMAGDEDRE